MGIVTARDLAQICRVQFSPTNRLILWAMAEIAIIGSDIQEIIGSAAALHILFGVSL